MSQEKVETNKAQQFLQTLGSDLQEHGIESPILNALIHNSADLKVGKETFTHPIPDIESTRELMTVLRSIVPERRDLQSLLGNCYVLHRWKTSNRFASKFIEFELLNELRMVINEVTVENAPADRAVNVGKATLLYILQSEISLF